MNPPVQKFTDPIQPKAQETFPMKIVKDYPPNHAQIVDVLHPSGNYVFTYGDTIYSPTTEILPPDIMVHEQVHMQQQTKDEGWFKRESPRKWWDKYLLDGRFRFQEELEAYQMQWRFVQRSVKDREMAHKMLVQMARDLSSANYGNLVGFSEAMEKIKEI